MKKGNAGYILFGFGTIGDIIMILCGFALIFCLIFGPIIVIVEISKMLFQAENTQAKVQRAVNDAVDKVRLTIDTL